MSEGDAHASDTVSVDGGRYNLVDGTWDGPGPTSAVIADSSPWLEDCVSVDGAWFDPATGRWRRPRVGGGGRSERVASPAGYVSVDGALLRLEVEPG